MYSLGDGAHGTVTFILIDDHTCMHHKTTYLYLVEAVGNQVLEEDEVLWSAGDCTDHIDTE